MTPTTMVFGREKSFRLGESSFQTHEDFFLGPGIELNTSTTPPAGFRPMW